MGRAVFLLRGGTHVWLLGAADEKFGVRQAVVAFAGILHPESGRQDAARGALQRRAESAVLEFFLWRAGVAAYRAGAVVPGKNSVELPLGALRFDFPASGGGAGNDCQFHDSHLHERFSGARSVWLGDSRRRV